MTEQIDLTRALSFGAVAEQYERARPSYPAALIDDLVALRPRSVLDVGAGTGKAAELLVARGLDVTTVEPDARMAAIVRRKGIAVDVSTLQEWNARGRTFDLITAGQSWHWMPQPEGSDKAFEVLQTGGHLAAFWNIGAPDERSRTGLDPVYQRLAPAILDDSLHAPSLEDKTEQVAPLLLAGFAPVTVQTYNWSTQYSAAQWVDCIATHSDHAALPAAQRGALLAAVGETIELLGGSITIDFTTLLLLGARGGGVTH